MELGLLGSGPAADAIAAACADIDLTVSRLEPTDGALSETPAIGAVVAPAGASIFAAANDAFDRWVAVEIGGLGGYVLDEIDASVSLFSPDSACFHCLRTRVAAHRDTASGTPASETEPSGNRSRVRLAGAVAGNRLVSLLTGDSEGGEITELPGPDRTLLPVPHCDCDPDDRPDRPLSLEHREVSVDDSLSRAERAVDNRLGPIAAVGERESFPVPYYIAEIGDTTGFSDTAAASLAAGVDPDWDRAYMKAIGEGLERYSAGVYRTADATMGSERTLSNPVSPTRFVRPDSYEQPDPEDRIQWIDGRRLPDGERVSLPAEFVQFPPATQRYRPAITTGLGLGNSTIEAILSGLYEAIERDATMLAWYSTFEPLGLGVDDENVTELTKRARAESLTVTPLLVTQDVDVPVVAVAVHREDEWPQFAVGSAANLDPLSAARSALAEALQNWMELRAMGPEEAAEQGGAIAEYADLPAAAQAFVDPDSRIPADSLGNPDLAGRDELDAVCDRLAEVDLDAYAARVTTQDVAQLGFEAVRVLVPSAQPLFTGEPFFGERAREVPRSMGFEPRLDREYHPYP
ncbi:bacteriocin biosynthesis protein SagD [Halonotius terrestris]|uniref:Bacteriocin biosynthesis protein SagD n=1 Tax=Halonotius terrestris TaxID=2487750 RepID=A0A8J8PD57_9EURY|nr:YcaO-like family protein [Halonotius terrestris]TQQ83022.1 bacteriocin biosynthesis protein SagD [Halonotius terrestris]